MNKLVLILVTLFIVGCSTKREYPPIEPYAPSTSGQSTYVIGVGDMLSISVWRNQDLSVQVPVRPDGKVSVPLVGDIQAAGLSAEQLAQKLTSELSNYVRTPQVTVIVENAVSSEFLHRVRITGAVNSPMSVPYRDGMTVMDIVLLAGGLTPLADANGAKLYRNTSEGTKAYPVYLEDILDKGDLRSNYAISPSDTITVPESRF